MNYQEKLPAVIAVLGPTAVGKTDLSLLLAEEFAGEIISVDSMQVYRFMDIGTAKVSKAEQQKVPHHLIDVVNPDEDYNVARFIDDAVTACHQIIGRGNLPFLVGGTGLYFKGLFEGIFDSNEEDSVYREKLHRRLTEEGRETLYNELCRVDPQSAQRIHPNDTHRIFRALEVYFTSGVPWSEHISKFKKQPQVVPIIKIGLYWEREQLYERINKRVNLMMQEGFLAEVEKLLQLGYDCSLHSMQSLGYRHLCNYIKGDWTFEETIELLARDTRRYAKRQMTWFRKDTDIVWKTPDRKEHILNLARESLKNNSQ